MSTSYVQNYDYRSELHCVAQNILQKIPISIESRLTLGYDSVRANGVLKKSTVLIFFVNVINVLFLCYLNTKCKNEGYRFVSDLDVDWDHQSFVELGGTETDR